MRSIRRATARWASFVQLLINHPLFDCIPVKTVVAADLESRNLTPASQSIHCAQMNLEILGYFGSRHDPAGRGIAAGVHTRCPKCGRGILETTPTRARLLVLGLRNICRTERRRSS